MTQLVELQEQIEEFEAAGIKVYGISYDPVAALGKFAEQRGISYNLLADEGSEVIKKFGILNTLIQPDEPMGARFHGIPFPGTYVVDEKGVVTEKFFQRHYGTRDSAGTLLHSALGRALIPEQAPQDAHADDQVKITAFLADEDLKLEYMSRLYIRFELSEGLHIYGAPVPEGFVATEIRVKESKGIRAGKPIYPATHPRRFEGLGATLNLLEGVVDIAVPVTATKDVRNWMQERTEDSVKIEIEVKYQACSETVCYPPRTVNLTLEVPLAEIVMPGSRG